MKIEEITGLEEFLTNFPLFEYQMIETEQLQFQQRVRLVCEQECERYDKTWACPPGVGDLETCRQRCLAYPYGFFFSSVAEVSDILNMEELLDTRAAHEEITDEIGNFFEDRGMETFILSTESCSICENCTYPDAPCRNPKRMHPCLESHGIVVTEIVEKQQMTYTLGGNDVLWFSLILFRPGQKSQHRVSSGS